MASFLDATAAYTRTYGAQARRYRDGRTLSGMAAAASGTSVFACPGTHGPHRPTSFSRLMLSRTRRLLRSMVARVVARTRVDPFISSALSIRSVPARTGSGRQASFGALALDIARIMAK